MIIRSAKIKDLPICERLLKIPEFKLASSGGYMTVKFLKMFLDKDFFLVAEENKEVVGCLIGDPTKAKVVIVWFFVVENKLRGKGVGTKLLKQFEKNCKKRKMRWVVLYSPAWLKANIKFYQKKKYHLGYQYLEFEKVVGRL